MKSKRTVSEYCGVALARLLLPDVANVRVVLGSILERRCASENPACTLLTQLGQNQGQFLRIWDGDCSGYLRFLRDPQMGTLKAQDDLMGRAPTCSPEEFDRYLGDFDAEMAAVRELGKIGYCDFEPVPINPERKTIDYRATFRADQVCVEVKNLRAPITILDVVASSIRARYREQPSLYPLRLLLTYYSDNTVTDVQREEIAQYVRALAGRTPPLVDALALTGGVEVTVRVERGSGEAVMMRGEGFDRHGEVSLPGFLNKVESQTRSALSQFASEPDRAHVLVFNINPPAGAIWSDFLNAAAERVQALSNGSIHCEFLLHGHRLAPDNV